MVFIVCLTNGAPRKYYAETCSYGIRNDGGLDLWTRNYLTTFGPAGWQWVKQIAEGEWVFDCPHA